MFKLFKKKEEKKDYYRIPFKSVFKSLSDGRLQMIPRRIKTERGIFEVEKGQVFINPKDTLLGIRWHDHKNKDIAGRFIYSPDLKDYVEIVGFITK